jgi:ClpP class serine protease
MLECSKAIAAITKPIYSAVSFCACSAAYLLAAQTDQIFVTESSLTGSIGVIAQHMEMSGSDAEAGLKYTTIFAGARKNDGNPHEPLSKGAQDAIQADVDSVMDMFIASVAAGRALPEADMRATEAAIYRGVQAVEAGLADVMGTPGDALLALAGIISTTSSVAAATRLRKEVRMKSTQVADPKLAANTAPPEEEPDDAKKEEAKATKKKAEDPADPEKEAEEDEEETLTGAACQEIAILCSIAGKSSLIAGFLQKQTSLAKVREHLLNAKADETTVITAAIDPSIGAQPKGAINPNDPKENPLLADAYRRQAAAEKQKGAR